jgi:hypothetical protein
MYTRTETNEKANLMWLAQDESNTLSGVSDGSVRDSNCQGTWAWALIRCTQDNAEPIGIDGRGREYVEGLDTQEAHSYRMEAIGLLSALHYVRKNLHWKGKLNWYMDSKSVIDTFDMCHNMRQTKWVKQRDKDVWLELIAEKKRWGRERIQIYHVESHVDKKKDAEGNKRIPTPIQNMNIHADQLADEVYTNDQIHGMDTSTLETYGEWVIQKNCNLVTGHWRNQLKEEIRLDRTKRTAKKDKLMWGLCPEEIDWKRMRKTSGNKTIREKLQAAKLMGGRRATNTFLKTFGITATDTCTLCGKHRESNRHALCFCTDRNLNNARNNTGQAIAALVTEAGGTSGMATVFRTIYGTEENGSATRMNGICNRNGTKKLEFPKKWQTAWRKGRNNERRTWEEEGWSRAAEITVTMGGATPMWTGVITKAWTWLLTWGGIPHQRKQKLIKNIRNELKEYANTTWKYRCQANEKARIEDKIPDAKYSKQLAKQFIRQLRIQGQMTVEQVVQLTAEQRMHLRTKINRNWEDGTKQMSLLKLDFTIIENDDTTTAPEAVTRKRTLTEVTKEASDTVGWKQAKLPWEYTPAETPPPSKQKRKRETTPDTTQTTITEKWNTPTTLGCKRRRPTKTKKKPNDTMEHTMKYARHA